MGATPANTDPFADPKAGEFMPVPSSLNDPAAITPSANATQLPSAAPDFKKSSSSGPAPDLSKSPSSESSAPVKNPFADAFITHVNDKYSGDIGKALSDKQTRNYAEALGLLDKSMKNFDFPADRIELIKKVLQDPDEDSLTKVNTVRMLIKH